MAKNVLFLDHPSWKYYIQKNNHILEERSADAMPRIETIETTCRVMKANLFYITHKPLNTVK